MIRTPILDAWRAAMTSGRHPLQIPGHKNQYVDGRQGWAADLVGEVVSGDLSMQGGLDDNAFTHHYVEDAEELWAHAVGADHSRFLVAGSSQGDIVAINAVADHGCPIALDRTSHRSTQAGLVISGALPVWMYPRIHPEFHIPIGIDPASVEAVDVQVDGFFVTSPAYVGTMSDVAALARAAHAKGAPLIIDQAWGAHLDFLDDMGAMRNGADIAVTSVHKALTGYSQTAVVSMRDGLVPRTALNRWTDLTSTTSPSGTLLATIDATRAAMERDGAERLALLVEATATMRARLARVPGLVVLDDANAGCRVDPLKVTLILPGTGADGVVLGQALWDLDHGPEIADHDTLVLTITVVDEPEWIQEMTDLVTRLIEAHRGEPRKATPLAVWRVSPEVAMSPRQAFFSRQRRVPLSEAVGEVSAEQFCPYPPGVPLVAPGERVTQETVDAIHAAARVGRVAYSSDPSLETILIIDA